MILNRQRSISIPSAALARFLGRVRRELKLGRSEVTVCFVTDSEIEALNRKFRGKRKPTDVLSFPLEPGAAANGNGNERPRGSVRKAHYLGDIAISPAVARRNARREGRTLDRELRILMLHGVLHLLGYDHEADQGEMDRKEARLRSRLGLA